MSACWAALCSDEMLSVVCKISSDMDNEWLDGTFLDELTYSETHVHGEYSLLHCFLCSISLSKECDKVGFVF